MKTITNIIKHTIITKLYSEVTKQGSDYITSSKKKKGCNFLTIFCKINNNGIKLFLTCATMEEKGIHRKNTQRTTLPNYMI